MGGALKLCFYKKDASRVGVPKGGLLGSYQEDNIQWLKLCTLIHFLNSSYLFLGGNSTTGGQSAGTCSHMADSGGCEWIGTLGSPITNFKSKIPNIGD